MHFRRYAATEHGDAVTAAGEGPFKWFAQCCDTDMIQKSIKAYLSERLVRPERTRGAKNRHHARTAANSICCFVKECLAPVLDRNISTETLGARSLLRGLPSQRIEADPSVRRTFTDEEIRAMFEACRDDARWSLILRILREIGLRVSCIGHLKYYMLLDSTHTPRHTCKVPEKGKQWRHFVTSLPLKQAIKRYAETMRDHVTERGDIFLLNPGEPSKPLSGDSMRSTLQSIAKAAGVVDVRVHPHAFRHTIVGELIDAGNSMELVSKFMGHASVETTAVNYWVPTTLELHEKMNNPFTGQFQQKARAAEEANEELQLVYEKLDAAMGLFHQLHGSLRASAAQGASAEDALRLFSLAVPEAGAILRGIAESTSASISGVQEMPPTQDAEEQASDRELEAMCGNSSRPKGSGGSMEPAPEPPPKRPRRARVAG